MTKQKIETIADVLETKDKALQIERVKALMMPVVDIVVRYDGRFGGVTVDLIGGQATPQQAREILTRAMEALSQKEVELLAQQQGNNNKEPEADLVNHPPLP